MLCIVMLTRFQWLICLKFVCILVRLDNTNIDLNVAKKKSIMLDIATAIEGSQKKEKKKATANYFLNGHM